MTAPRHRNIAFKAALVVLSVALAAFGILGWADAADGLDAFAARSWADLDPLWPVYLVAAIACLAAQILAACAVVNFARLAKAPLVWRGLALAFYAVAVFFAAYSADKGAQVVLSSAHRSAYETRETERTRLQTEIQTLTQAIEQERQKLPSDTSNTVTSRQQAALALFNAATAAPMARLPVAQQELARLPAIPREAPQGWMAAMGVFAIFLAWAVLEPWGYALAERGREAVAVAAVAAAPLVATQSANVHWLRRVGAILTLGWISHFAPTVAVAETLAPPAPQRQEPIEISAWQDAKALAFSMRDRYEVAEIAAKVKRDKSTVYRWFRERDQAAAKAA